MRHTLLFFLLGLCTLSASAQEPPLNMTLLGHRSYTTNLNDIWADVHNGREYAFVGTQTGLSIVDITVPTAPFEVFFAPGPNTTWRDPFYYNGHAYCVNESSGGLLIVDMGPLPPPGPVPTVMDLPVSYFTGVNYPWTTAHTTSVDPTTGRAFIYGSNYGVGGAIILDLSQDPQNPIELGVWNQYYIHDGFARGDTLWAGCIYDGIAAVVNISNPTSPQLLTTWNTPSNFTHNIWPNDDNSVVFTTDEVTSAFITAYDVTDLSNIQELDRANHPLSVGVIPHNVYYLNDFLISSHYRDGVTVHDASDPSNIILTGYYDTSPMEGNGFNSVWGVWPYLPSGNIVASDMELGLYIFAPTYTRAARIEGTVTSASSGVQLSGVNVQVTGTAIAETTGIAGTYASGLAQGGSFTVTFVKGGYLPVTVNDVQLVNGQTTVLDVEMTPDTPFTLQVNVTESPGGGPVEGATITFVNSLFNITATTDANGIYLDENFFDGTYEVTIGRWGNRTACGTYTVNADNNIIEIQLPKQYYDDFALDFGWEVTGPASTGVWVRDAPIGTFYEGNMANPDSHSGSGCGNFAFVTGNAGPPVNIDDVDDGATILTSPIMDLTDMTNPVVSFQYWFYTGGGSSPSNDEMLVRVLNGTDMVTIESLSTTASQWSPASFLLSNFISITDEMRVQFFIQDAPPGHLVEGGVDFFQVDESNGLSDISPSKNLRIFPNPSTTGEVFISTSDFSGSATVRLLDLQGREVSTSQTMTSNPFKIKVPDHSGIYLIEVTDLGARSFGRVVVAPN